jgi:hypothetical protein
MSKAVAVVTENAGLVNYEPKKGRMRILAAQAEAEMCRKAEDGGKLPGRVFDFVELVQQKYRQPNQTAGRIVPIRVLERECRPPPKLLHPRQLLLDLGKP